MPVTGALDQAPWRRAAGAVAAAIPLLPVALLLFDGALTAPLWLDEIAYHYWEGDLALRAQEVGRPLSPWIRLLSNYCYGDLQRAVRAALDAVGVRFLENPEAVLRSVSLTSYLLTLGVVAFAVKRTTGSLRQAVLGTTVVASTRIFLDQAFEARVYMFACLAVLLHAVLFDEATKRPTTLKLASLAALSLVVAQSHPWTICLFSGYAGAFLLGLAGVRALRGSPAVAAAAVGPGLLSLGSQWAYLRLTEPDLPGFPMFAPHPWTKVLPSVLAAPFNGALDLHTASGAADEIVYQASAFLLAAAIGWAAISQVRNRPDPLLVAGLLALAVSSILAGTYGNIVLGRHQVFLYAVLFFAVTRRPTRTGTFLLIALAAANASRLGTVAAETHLKSNGRMVAAVVTRFGARDDLLVVQNPVRWGFPDPIYTFPADFYLNVLRPGPPPMRILELPALDDAAGTRVISPNYLRCGPALLAKFTSTPVPRWHELASRWTAERLWLLSPLLPVPTEAAVTDAFEATLHEIGFRGADLVVRLPQYQPARLRLFVRGKAARQRGAGTGSPFTPDGRKD